MENRKSSRAAGRRSARSTGRGGSSNATTDHDEIRRWAEARGGVPASVGRTTRGSSPGMIRIEFDKNKPSLKQISWDDWFRKFDENNLTFLYQDESTGGRTSRFNKLISSRSRTAGSGRRPKTMSAGGQGRSS